MILNDKSTAKHLNCPFLSMLKLLKLVVIAVDENDTHKTLIEAIPKLLNWIRSFQYSEVNGYIFY